MFRRQLKRFRTRHRWRRDLTSHARSAIEERSGTVGNDNELARQRLLSSRGVSIPTCHRTQVSQSFGEFQVSQCGTPSQRTSSQTRSQAETRRQETHRPHAQGSLCHRVTLDSVAHWWVPARTPTAHQCFHGGRPWVARDTLHATPQRRDQGCHATPWLPTHKPDCHGEEAL